MKFELDKMNRSIIDTNIDENNVVNVDIPTLKDTYVETIETYNSSIEDTIRDKVKEILLSRFHYNNIVVGNSEGNIRYDLLVNNNVIFEFKRLNSNEMPTKDDLNKKGFQQAVVYFLRETIENKREPYSIIITNSKDWFFIDGRNLISFLESKRDIYQKIQNKISEISGEQHYKTSDNLSMVYKKIGEFLEEYDKPFKCIYCNAEKDFNFLLKLLSKDNLERKIQMQTVTINESFYKELLYILGLEIDSKTHNIKPSDIQNSLYYEIIKAGKLHGKQIDFEVALSLIITWLNRILFMKLIEAKLLDIHNNDASYRFLSDNNLTFGFLQNFFFDTFAKNINERFNRNYDILPYLNSSLFEQTETENHYIQISDIVDLGTTMKTFTGEEKPLLKYLLQFLNRWDFTGKGNKENKENNSISPAVLGLVFERLNAYKDGSYYTPSQITDYMAKEVIEKTIIEKVNQVLNTDFETLEDIRNWITNTTKRKQIAGIINLITILDPAVGSGHFLVSALNAMLIAKFKVGVLMTEEGHLLGEYCDIDLHNYDLYIVDNQSDVFTYTMPALKNSDQYKIQKTLFDAKRQIIENNLFGVDINLKSVEIARLRLWIELLKNAYYTAESDYKTMETLPNIDININVGDSLLASITKIENLSVFNDVDFSKYKKLFNQYQNTPNKDLRKAIKIEINNEKQRMIRTQQHELNLLGYFDLVWSLDFPQTIEEVNNKFIFTGFDIVIGNPPYIQLEKNGGNLANLYKNYKYETFSRSGDIYTLFYEKGLQLLKPEGYLCFITSNKWMRSGYGEKLRGFFIKHNPQILIDLGPGVFESATVDTNILLIQNQTNQNELKAVKIQKPIDKNEPVDIKVQLKERGVPLINLTKDAWFIGSIAEQKLKEKIERIGKPLKEWDVNIYYGIKTGLNEAFIIDSQKREEILDNCKDDAEQTFTNAIIKPILRGRDIKRYHYKWAGLWVIVIPSGWTNENITEDKQPEEFIYEQFPSLMSHLKQYKVKAKKRDDQGDYWWELRPCAYYFEFEMNKVVYSEIVRQPQFYYDTEKIYVEATSFLMTGNNVKYICGLLNSKPITYFFKEWYAGGGLGENGYRYKKAFLENLPLHPITPSNQPTVQQIETLIDKILSAKKENPQANTIEWEREIDRLVYGLYELTNEEIAIVEHNQHNQPVSNQPVSETENSQFWQKYAKN